jgi:hypothetical protein
MYTDRGKLQELTQVTQVIQIKNPHWAPSWAISVLYPWRRESGRWVGTNTRGPGVKPENKPRTGGPKIPAPGRDTSGRFVKGATGNAGGRPLENAEVKELARRQGPAAIARLTQLMYCDDPQVSIAASRALLDRGYGRPEQSVEVSGNVNHNLPYTGDVLAISDPVDAARAYQELILGNRDLRSVKLVSNPQAALPAPAALAPSRPRQELLRPAGLPVDVRFTGPARTDEVEVPAVAADAAPGAALEPPTTRRPPTPPEPENPGVLADGFRQVLAHDIHRPIADSACRECRKLWITQ